MNIRGKSVGEEVEVTVTCPDDNKTTVDVTIPVNAIEVQKNKDHKDTIKLDDTLMMKMRYPSLDQFVNANFDTGTEGSQMEQSFDMIAACIDTIYTDEEAWTTSDCSKTEVVEFLDQLNTKQFQEIEAFFTTMPKLSYEIKVTNPKTKKKGTVVLEGLEDLFRIALSHMDLESYYRINFALIQYHKYSLTEIENLIPWERDIYVELLKQHLEEEKGETKGE